MKKILFILAMMLIMPLTVSANYIGEFTRNINISLNCEFCSDDTEKTATFQLFANGEMVEGASIVLNEENEFKGSFEDLDVFDENFAEIEYEVKMLDGEEYKSIPKEDITYEKVPIKKWVQVMPEDIKPGHEYVLFTDNWNYEQNGYGKFVLMSGDMYLEEINAIPEYNIINGKKSYYVLDGEPNEESIWTTSEVSKDDLEYKAFKDYIQFNTYKDTKLSLAGYNYGGWMYFGYRETDNENYYIEDEYAFNTNKVKIVPIEGTVGRFYISSINTTGAGAYTVPAYVGVDHFYNVVAQTVPEYSAQFLAFEYIESEDVETVYNMKIGTVLCEQAKVEEETTEKNPETGNGIITIVTVASIISMLAIIKFTKKRLNY